jgi:hypothetical protein
MGDQGFSRFFNHKHQVGSVVPAKDLLDFFRQNDHMPVKLSPSTAA